jgi:hypothetical protein
MGWDASSGPDGSVFEFPRSDGPLYDAGLIECIGGPFDGEYVQLAPHNNLLRMTRDGESYRGVNTGTRWWFVYEGPVA